METFINKKILFSGTFGEYDRKDLQKMAEDAGAIIASGVSKNLDFLVAGEKMGPAKLKKANELDVPIISLDEFFFMVKGDSVLEDFNLDDVKGSEAPFDLIKKLKALNWSCFKPYLHGERLREILQQQEADHGINEAHSLCYEMVKKNLQLLHPCGHQGLMQYYDISPDEKWLATGSWIGEDYEKGGVLQIWEIETGRVVNQFRIPGGIGWPDYKGMEWGPDSDKIALAYDTNGIGVWNPFSDNQLVYAYVTDGWDSPPHFNWAQDGQSIFIQCPIDNPGTDNENAGCWIKIHQTKGNISSSAKAGLKNKFPVKNETKFSKINSTVELIKGECCYETKGKKLIILGAYSVRFFDMESAGFYGDFHDFTPEEDHELIIDHRDFGDWPNFLIHPAFPVKDDDKETWGYCFESGIVIAPKNFEVENHLAFSLGCKFAWPLRWCSYTRAYSFEELVKKDVVIDFYCLLSNTQLAEFKAKHNSDKKVLNKKTASQKTKQLPADDGKTCNDILNIAIDSLKSLDFASWGSHIDETYIEIALTELIQSRIEIPLEILDKISAGRRSMAAAEFSFHVIKRNLPYESFIKAAKEYYDETIPYAVQKTDSMLAIFYFCMNDNENMEKYTSKALAVAKDDRNKWNIINMFFMTDRMQDGFDHIKKWNLQYNVFYSDSVFFNLIWYKSMSDMLNLHTQLQSNNTEEHDYYEYFILKMIYSSCFNEVETIYKNFKYGDRIGLRIAQYLIDKSIDENPALEHFPQKHSREWFKWLEIYSQKDVSAVKSIVEKKDVNADKIDSYENMFNFSLALKRCGAEKLYDAEIRKKKSGFLAVYYAACAAAGYPEYIEKALSLFEDPFQGKNLETLFYILEGAFLSEYSDYTSLVEKTRDTAMAMDKYITPGDLVTILATFGDINNAYKCWKKISKGNRVHVMDGLFRGLCRNNDYNGIFELLMFLAADDMNRRPMRALQALVTLTDSRGDNFREYSYIL